jgi:predicted phosphohydrolase
MIIQYASDLHLEFSQNKNFLRARPLQPEGDLLLLAGDIVPFAVMDKHSDFFDYVSDNFPIVYWIPGNHEYYHYNIASKSGILNEKIRDNVFLVNNLAVRRDEIRFIFTTLWAKISPAYQWQIERSVSDFQCIKYNGFRFSADRFNHLHEESLSFLKNELLQNKMGVSVVVTHHVPTFMHYPEKYKGDVINEAFAVELFDFIEAEGPDYWIYGHHHHNAPDFRIGKTWMLTNQLGYVGYNEHLLFDTVKFVTV